MWGGELTNDDAERLENHTISAILLVGAYRLFGTSLLEILIWLTFWKECRVTDRRALVGLDWKGHKADRSAHETGNAS